MKLWAIKSSEMHILLNIFFVFLFFVNISVFFRLPNRQTTHPRTPPYPHTFTVPTAHCEMLHSKQIKNVFYSVWVGNTSHHFEFSRNSHGFILDAVSTYIVYWIHVSSANPLHNFTSVQLINNTHTQTQRDSGARTRTPFLVLAPISAQLHRFAFVGSRLLSGGRLAAASAVFCLLSLILVASYISISKICCSRCWIRLNGTIWSAERTYCFLIP